MTIGFILGNRVRWAIYVMCRVLAVYPSGYYKWCRRDPDARILARVAVLVSI